MFRVKVYGANIWCFGVLLLRDFHFVNSLPIFDHICRLIWFEFPPKPKSNQSWKRQFQSDPNVRCNTPANSISQFWNRSTMMEKYWCMKNIWKKNISSKQSKREFNLLQKSGKVTVNQQTVNVKKQSVNFNYGWEELKLKEKKIAARGCVWGHQNLLR